MTDFIYIGIDPGLDGGIAFIGTNRVYAWPLPLAGKEIDIHRLLGSLPPLDEHFSDWLSETCRVYIEKVGAMPGQGVTSMFRFGFVTGQMHGAFQAIGIPIQLVSPRTWKKVVLADTDHSKEATIAWCRRAYPQVDLLATPRSVKPHSGMADALCIAHYGKITHEQ